MQIPKTLAFTAKATGRANMLVSEILIELPSYYGVTGAVPQKFQAIWDTGATNSVITMAAAKQLNLVPTGKITTVGVNGSSVVNRYLINLVLPNNLRFINLPVSESVGLGGGNFHFLIGMDVIGQGDFAVSQANNQTWFSFRFPPAINPIDFVAEINAARSKLQLQQNSSGGGSQRRTSRRK